MGTAVPEHALDVVIHQDFLPAINHTEPRTVVRDWLVTTAADELTKRKIRPEWALFCQDLLDLDGIKTSKDDFVQFCIDLYVLDRNIAILVNASVKDWNAGMQAGDYNRAANKFWVVFTGFQNALDILGVAGAKKLSSTIFHAGKLPEKVQMVWNYIDFKTARSCAGNPRSRKVRSPWDDVFTIENVATNEDMRVVVIVGMHVFKIMELYE